MQSQGDKEAEIALGRQNQFRTSGRSENCIKKHQPVLVHFFVGFPWDYKKRPHVCSPLFKYSTEVIFHYISTSSSLAREVKVGNVPREEDTQVTSSEGFFSIKNL